MRMHAAAIPGVIFAIAVSLMIGAVAPGGRLAALVTVALGGSGAMLLYVMFAKAFGVSELDGPNRRRPRQAPLNDQLGSHACGVGRPRCPVRFGSGQTSLGGNGLRW